MSLQRPTPTHWTSPRRLTPKEPMEQYAGESRHVYKKKWQCRMLTLASPLHGIPILIKNNIATMDKMNNTGESRETLSAAVVDAIELDRGPWLVQRFRGILSWLRSCGLLAPSSSASRISANGRTTGLTTRPMDGQRMAAKSMPHTIPYRILVEAQVGAE